HPQPGARRPRRAAAGHEEREPRRMILRLAIRSLLVRPWRAAVPTAGFGLGIGVMVALLGVGQVIIEQAHSPALHGGGDLVLSSPTGPLDSARSLLTNRLGSRG